MVSQMCMVMQRSNAKVKRVQTEGALASQENIIGWPHGFGFQSCIRYAKVEYRGHGIHGSDSRRSNEGGTPNMDYFSSF
jgi:hypothetical protein